MFPQFGPDLYITACMSAHVGGTEKLYKDEIIVWYPPPIQSLRNFLWDPTGCYFLVAMCWLPCLEIVPPIRAGSLLHCLYLSPCQWKKKIVKQWNHWLISPSNPTSEEFFVRPYCMLLFGCHVLVAIVPPFSAGSLLHRLTQLLAQPTLVFENNFQRTKWGPITPLQTSLWWLFCVTPL